MGHNGSKLRSLYHLGTTNRAAWSIAPYGWPIALRLPQCHNPRLGGLPAQRSLFPRSTPGQETFRRSVVSNDSERTWIGDRAPNPKCQEARCREEVYGPSTLARASVGQFAFKLSALEDELERQNVPDWVSTLSWGHDEAGLVTELQAGSETAFDWLVTHYHGPVYSLSLSMLGDTADAADSTQEVFLKAFRGIRSFRRGSSLKTWLYRIAVREALNNRRWFKRHLQKNISIDAEPDEGCAAVEVEDHSATPYDQMAAHEIQTAVQGALQQIPEVFRSAVVLRDLEGLSYEEVAEVLDCSVGTVKSRILRGRRTLKELLEPMLGEKEFAQRREATRREAASAAHFGSQIGLEMAYVRAPANPSADEMTRPRQTREEQS